MLTYINTFINTWVHIYHSSGLYSIYLSFITPIQYIFIVHQACTVHIYCSLGLCNTSLSFIRPIQYIFIVRQAYAEHIYHSSGPYSTYLSFIRPIQFCHSILYYILLLFICIYLYIMYYMHTRLVYLFLSRRTYRHCLAPN